MKKGLGGICDKYVAITEMDSDGIFMDQAIKLVCCKKAYVERE
jgi:hypothetical protein